MVSVWRGLQRSRVGDEMRQRGGMNQESKGGKGNDDGEPMNRDYASTLLNQPSALNKPQRHPPAITGRLRLSSTPPRSDTHVTSWVSRRAYTQHGTRTKSLGNAGHQPSKDTNREQPRPPRKRGGGPRSSKSTPDEALRDPLFP